MSFDTKDSFSFIMPAEIQKSEDGDWKIAGLASTESKDQQQEVIMQKGIDLTPIDKKRGYFNFDHLPGPENLIGTIDGYKQSDQGLYVHGKLFKNHSKAKAVYEIMSSLGEGDRGRVGLSVEGKILKRNSANPSIIEKCQINKVAVTLNPVNQETFADLVKSMSSSQVEFNSTEEHFSDVEHTDEPTFTATQVMTMIQKALGAGAAGMKAPADRTGGEALSVEELDDDMDKGGPGSGPKKKLNTKLQVATYQERPGAAALRQKIENKKMKDNLKPSKVFGLKRMSKSLYKSNIIKILDNLQVLYPYYSRVEIWEAVKDRLDQKFPDVKEFGKGQIRLKNTSPKEREHALYEQARQRGDYEENKNKTRAQLAEVAKESGAEKKEQAKIRAQADAARQVGDRDHVRPGVK